MFKRFIDRIVLWVVDRRAQRAADAVKEMYDSTHDHAMKTMRSPHDLWEASAQVGVPDLKPPTSWRGYCACAVTRKLYGDGCFDFQSRLPRVDLSNVRIGE